MQVVRETGVQFNACVVCANEYGVSKNLENLGIELTHTGEMLTESLQNDDVKVISF